MARLEEDNYVEKKKYVRLIYLWATTPPNI